MYYTGLDPATMEKVYTPVLWDIFLGGIRHFGPNPIRSVRPFLIIFKSRNNYMKLVATVLVLPSAKIAVSYLILLPQRYVIRNYIQALKLQKESYQLYMM